MDVIHHIPPEQVIDEPLQKSNVPVILLKGILHPLSPCRPVRRTGGVLLIPVSVSSHNEPVFLAIGTSWWMELFSSEITAIFDSVHNSGKGDAVIFWEAILGRQIWLRPPRIWSSKRDDIGLNNLHFNLVVHEFEALLYANPSAFQDYSKAVAEMMEKAMLTSGGNPELINNCFDTSPSHRITQVYPEYSKPTVGVIISKRIGINTMREACPHFNEWLLFLGL